MNPEMTIAVCSEDAAFAARWVGKLKELAGEERPGINLIILEATPASLPDILQISSLQALVLHGGDIVGQIGRCLSQRPHLDLFPVPDQGASQAIDALLRQPVRACFDTEESDFALVLRELLAAIQRKSATPFADTLRDYVNSARDAWHTPGHSGGDSMKNSDWVSDFYHFLGEHIFSADLSVSVQVLDSLLEPHSIIQEAQDLAATAFGARKTFFATNGTSTANKVILQSLLHPGDKILLDRGSHKSAHHGIILCGAMPVYLPSSLQLDYGLYGPVSRRQILQAIDANPDARALLLTSCTYDGLRYDLEPIIRHAHHHNIKVIIDEAWYAHAAFHPALRPTALEAQADYVSQSTHKMLSAFSQASMIHVNDPAFDEQRFREHFNMHASTSPQYAIIASLDVARKQMSMEGYGLLENTLALARCLRETINATGVFRVLELDDMLAPALQADGIALDTSKLTVDISDTGMSADAVRLELFERYNIQVEKTTFNTITLLLTIGTTPGKVMRLENALQRMAAATGPLTPGEASAPPPPLPDTGPVRRLPRDVFFERGQLAPLMDADANINPALSGAICADQITPYPPGIPVLVPGQEISEAVLRYLRSILLSPGHIEVHGLTYRHELPHLRIAETVTATLSGSLK